MARGADLFVVCKNCGSEVSPYVTECPYCGQRVRKRAPKIDRDKGVITDPAAERDPRAERKRRPRRTRESGRFARRRHAESSPSSFSAPSEGRPYATIALVAASFAVYLYLVVDPARTIDLVLQPDPDWRVLTAPFVHLPGGGGSVFAGGAFQLATMIAVGTYGWLLERRHGWWAVALVALLSGAGGMAAAAALESGFLGTGIAGGANGIGLGLLAAWAIPDLKAWRRDEDYDGDLLGTAVIAAVLLLMPLAVEFASATAGVVGLVVGLLAGHALARRGER